MIGQDKPFLFEILVDWLLQAGTSTLFVQGFGVARGRLRTIPTMVPEDQRRDAPIGPWPKI